MTDTDYARLSQIAPTPAQSGAYVEYGMPWQVQTRMIGRALGREARAQELIAGVEARFAEVRARHPEFEGATAVVLNGAAGEGMLSTYRPDAPRVQILTDLGFEIPAEIAELPADSDQATLSVERLDLLDRDLLVWNLGLFSTVADVEAIPGYAQLAATQQGRNVFVTDERLYAALAFASVLSLPFALEWLEPMLAAAVDGDPATVP